MRGESFAKYKASGRMLSASMKNFHFRIDHPKFCKNFGKYMMNRAEVSKELVQVVFELFEIFRILEAWCVKRA